jgi:VRR-NUC domain
VSRATSSRAHEAARMTEMQLLQALVDVARLSGWLVFHTYDSRRSAPGFPDLILLRPPRLLVIEAKSLSGRATPEQDTWLSAFAALAEGAEVQVHLWRPSDLDAALRIIAARPRRTPA